MDSVQNFLQQAQGTVQNAIDQAPGALQNALHQADGAFQKLAHDAPGIIQNAQTNVQKFANDAPGMIQNAINAATGASTQLQTRQLGKNGPYVCRPFSPDFCFVLIMGSSGHGRGIWHHGTVCVLRQAEARR